MTEKLYYIDAYTKEFYAEVLQCEPCDGGFCVVLDKSAFFPEEGGQYSDTGYIGLSEVTRVTEKNGIIYHFVKDELALGNVLCSLNFAERYEKMQIHTGEHILSGLFHSFYGYENVGFHLGADVVTMDINAVLSDDEIRRVEAMANEVVYKNVPVTAYFPTPEELLSIHYRSKLELTENVRIVKIGEYDSCACCAPHVAASGEVGIIRIYDYVKHRGGTRITMSAGSRVFRECLKTYESTRAISSILSVPREDVADGVSRLSKECEELRCALKRAREEYYLHCAESIAPTDGNLVLYYPDADSEGVKTLANALIDRVGGILVMLYGKEGECRYLIVSQSRDLRAMSRDINSALLGRGGGKPEAIQGSFGASLEKIRAYFE